jgi:branched-chain amino acid transport system permease protein
MDVDIKNLPSKSNFKTKLIVGLRNPYFQYLLFALILVSLPLLQQIGILKSSQITILASVIIYSIAALGLNLLLGYSGLASLGTAGFMGLAAYATAYFVKDLSLPYGLSVVIAILIPLVVGIIVGFISLRIEGMYLAIATLIVGEILLKTFTQLSNITNGAIGKSMGYPTLMIFGKLDKSSTFMLLGIVLALFMVLAYNIVRGRTGRALMAMRGSESAAQAMGINILKYRLITFSFATLFSAVAGIMWVSFSPRIYPSDWTLSLSLNVLAIIVIGGIKSIWGTILGAFVVVGVPTLILSQLPIIGTIPGLSYIFTGILIIVVIMFYPYGLIYIGHDFKKWKAGLKNIYKKLTSKPSETKAGE